MGAEFGSDHPMSRLVRLITLITSTVINAEPAGPKLMDLCQPALLRSEVKLKDECGGRWLALTHVCCIPPV